MERRLTEYLFAFVLIGVVAFFAGLLWSVGASAAENPAQPSGQKEKRVRVVYPKNSRVDLDEMGIQGELRNPGEFYFQRRPEEKFDSLVKRRPNFHREMLRDAVLSK